MEPPSRTRWEIFRSWHGQEAFWRDYYLRSLSGVTVVIVAYWLGALFGLFNRHPWPWVTLAISVGVIAYVVAWEIATSPGGPRLHDWLGWLPTLGMVALLNFVIFAATFGLPF